MGERRYAILIASSKYKDPTLQDLLCPENDVDGLNDVLTSENYGQFTKTYVLKNCPHSHVLLKINQVLKQVDKNDFVLIYYSGHGTSNRIGKLHLTTTNTMVNSLESTSIPIENIRNCIDVSPSNKIALLLDSCFSGAAGNAFIKSGVGDQLQLSLSGRGIYIMTSSTGIQTALEKEGDMYSVFTKNIIEGITSGNADLDNNGLISMDEIYKYVHDHVLDESHQEPMRWNLDVQGDLVIAKTSKYKKEEHNKQIRQMLLDQSSKGLLPDSILTRSLKIISTDCGQLSNIDLRYATLIDKYFYKKIELNEFIEEWYNAENKQEIYKNNSYYTKILRTLPSRLIFDKSTMNYLEMLHRSTTQLNINNLSKIYIINLWLLLPSTVFNNYIFAIILIILLTSGFQLGRLSHHCGFLPGILLGWFSFPVFIVSILVADKLMLENSVWMGILTYFLATGLSLWIIKYSKIK